MFYYLQQGEQMVRHSVELARSSGAPFSPPHTAHTSPLKHHYSREREIKREIKTEKESEKENEGICDRDDDSCNISDTMTPIEFILRHTGFEDISSAYDYSNCQVTPALI
jgi:hypothetical protein